MDYTTLSIFFDFGNPGYLSGTTTYYYDNVVFSGNPAHVEGVEEVITFFYPSILTAEQPLVFKGEGDAPVDLRVYDVRGRLVQQEMVQSGQFLNLNSCMPGMYVFSWGDRTQKITVTASN